MKKQTQILKIMQACWDGSALHGESWQRLNSGLSELLNNLISLEIEFNPGDIAAIYSSFRGGYWFGVSSNGKSAGEHFYRTACLYNKSAAKSFENWRERKPFILSGKRLYEGFEFTYNGLFYTVTGFDDEKGRCYAVGYKKRFNGYQRKKTEKRTLLNFDNAEFLELRKNFEILP